jgi:hypothetical protein
MQALGRWPVGLKPLGNADEPDLGPEGVIELVGSKRPGVEWTGDEFQEWIEVGELRLRRVIVMRGGVVHVIQLQQPHDSVNPALDVAVSPLASKEPLSSTLSIALSMKIRILALWAVYATRYRCKVATDIFDVYKNSRLV